MKFSKTIYWTSSEQLERLCQEMRGRVSQEGSSSRMEALDSIIVLSQVDPLTFHELWIEPLLAVGVSVETACACIAQSHFQPN